jgi:hypothetical protein
MVGREGFSKMPCLQSYPIRNKSDQKRLSYEYLQSQYKDWRLNGPFLFQTDTRKFSAGLPGIARSRSYEMALTPLFMRITAAVATDPFLRFLPVGFYPA